VCGIIIANFLGDAGSSSNRDVNQGFGRDACRGDAGKWRFHHAKSHTWALREITWWIAATLASWDGAECSTTPDAGRDVIFTNQWPLLHVLALSGATGRGRSLIGVTSAIAQRVPSTIEPAAESRRGEHRGFDASRATYPWQREFTRTPHRQACFGKGCKAAPTSGG
jgi:hypothetical protein